MNRDKLCIGSSMIWRVFEKVDLFVHDSTTVVYSDSCKTFRSSTHRQWMGTTTNKKYNTNIVYLYLVSDHLRDSRWIAAI